MLKAVRKHGQTTSAISGINSSHLFKQNCCKAHCAKRDFPNFQIYVLKFEILLIPLLANSYIVEISEVHP